MPFADSLSLPFPNFSIGLDGGFGVFFFLGGGGGLCLWNSPNPTRLRTVPRWAGIVAVGRADPRSADGFFSLQPLFCVTEVG